MSYIEYGNHVNLKYKEHAPKVMVGELLLILFL